MSILLDNVDCCPFCSDIVCFMTPVHTAPGRLLSHDPHRTIAPVLTDYTKDSGYFLDGGQITIPNQTIMQVLPPINLGNGITAANLVSASIRFATFTNDCFCGPIPPKRGMASMYRCGVRCGVASLSSAQLEWRSSNRVPTSILSLEDDVSFAWRARNPQF
jgi:hypothetical protein